MAVFPSAVQCINIFVAYIMHSSLYPIILLISYHLWFQSVLIPFFSLHVYLC